MMRLGAIDWKALARAGFGAGVLSAGGAFAAGSTDDALLRCRAQADTAGRLACYDAITVPPAPSTPLPTARLPGAAPTAAVPPTPTAAFGLESRRLPDALDEVRSQITGRFEGWGPGTRFTLANGQVWEVSDGSYGTYNLQSPAVTVQRASMGTFMLQIEGAGKAPRVRRVQ